jgi:hypothetical protein
MELKNTKSKPKRSPAGTSKSIIHINPQTESPVIETLKKTKNVNQNDSEVILNETVEKQDVFFELPKNINKNFLKPDAINSAENKRKSFLAAIPWILLVIFLVSSFYLWSQLSEIKKDPLKAALTETTDTITAVGKIMLLPDNETPKVATLTDADLTKIKSQAFFINAKVGDKVLVYSTARKVILYNPNINKIIEVANLNSENSSAIAPSI